MTTSSLCGIQLSPRVIVEYESVMNSLPSGGKISCGVIAIVSWRCWIVLACF